MALRLDPQVAAQLAEVIEAVGETKPSPVGDVESRRIGGHRMMEYVAANSAPVEGIDTERFSVTGADGAALDATWYRRPGEQPGSAALYIHGGARLAVMGESAGGGLAAGVCLMARDRRGPAVAQQLLIYPMLDDRPATPDPALLPFLTWTYDDNLTGWGALLGDKAGGDGVSPYAAPARATDLAGLPDTYIDVGDLDIFREDDIGYARRLSAAGVPTEFHLHPGCPHIFETVAATADVAIRVLADRVRRLKSL